jgi:alkaline phosphatase D
MLVTMVSEVLCNHFDIHLQLQGSPSVATRNPFDISLANFTVEAGANHLKRNVAGGRVESGALQRGATVPSNLTLNTLTGTWNVTGFDQMFITYPAANTTRG